MISTDDETNRWNWNKHIALEAAVPFIGKDVIAIEQFAGGMNHVYKIEGRSCTVIVRVKQEQNLEAALHECRREIWCIDQARKHGIPSPEILASGQLADSIYMVHPFIPGQSGDRYTDDWRTLYHQIGQHTKVFHAIPIDESGYSLFHGDVNTQEKLHDMIRYNIDSLGTEDELIRLGVYDAASCEEIAQWLASLLTVNFRFGLCHGDLSPRNTIIADDGQHYLLDWGCARIAAVPHQDIFELICDMTDLGEINADHLQAFCNGYGMDMAAYEQLLIEMNAYLLLRSFDGVRWALERKPSRLPVKVHYASKVWQYVRRQGR